MLLPAAHLLLHPLNLLQRKEWAVKLIIYKGVCLSANIKSWTNIWDLGFSRRWLWRILASVVWCQDHLSCFGRIFAFIFRVEEG